MHRRDERPNERAIGGRGGGRMERMSKPNRSSAGVWGEHIAKAVPYIVALSIVVSLGATGYCVFIRPSLEEEPVTTGAPTRVTSRTDACAADVRKGLETFRDQRGLPYKLTDGDERVLFDRSIDESYYRDAIEYRVSFRVEVRGAGCQLVLWRRTTSQPGTTKTTGSFGAIDLPSCTCQ